MFSLLRLHFLCAKWTNQGKNELTGNNSTNHFFYIFQQRERITNVKHWEQNSVFLLTTATSTINIAYNSKKFQWFAVFSDYTWMCSNAYLIRILYRVQTLPLLVPACIYRVGCVSRIFTIWQIGKCFSFDVIFAFYFSHSSKKNICHLITFFKHQISILQHKKST